MSKLVVRPKIPKRPLPAPQQQSSKGPIIISIFFFFFKYYYHHPFNQQQYQYLILLLLFLETVPPAAKPRQPFVPSASFKKKELPFSIEPLSPAPLKIPPPPSVPVPSALVVDANWKATWDSTSQNWFNLDLLNLNLNLNEKVKVQSSHLFSLQVLLAHKDKRSDLG